LYVKLPIVTNNSVDSALPAVSSNNLPKGTKVFIKGDYWTTDGESTPEFYFGTIEDGPHLHARNKQTIETKGKFYNVSVDGESYVVDKESVFTKIEDVLKRAPTVDRSTSPISKRETKNIDVGTQVNQTSDKTINKGRITPYNDLKDMAKAPQEWDIMHTSLNHRSKNILSTFYQNNGIKPKGRMKTFCDTCAATKMKKKHISKEDDTKFEFLECVSVDLTGPLTPSLHNYKYILGLKDNMSNWFWTLTIRDRSQNSINEAMKRWKKNINVDVLTQIDLSNKFIVAYAETTIDAASFLVDNEKTFTSDSLKRVFPNSKIKSFGAESPQLNKIEKPLDDIKTSITASLHWANCLGHSKRLTLWVTCANTVTFVHNRLPNRGNPGGKSPYFLRFGQEFNWRNQFLPWGCKGYVYIPKSLRRKENFSQKSRKCGLLLIHENVDCVDIVEQLTYYCIIESNYADNSTPSTPQYIIVKSRNVTWDPTTPYFDVDEDKKDVDEKGVPIKGKHQFKVLPTIVSYDLTQPEYEDNDDESNNKKKRSKSSPSTDDTDDKTDTYSKECKKDDDTQVAQNKETDDEFIEVNNTIEEDEMQSTMPSQMPTPITSDVETSINMILSCIMPTESSETKEELTNLLLAAVQEAHQNMKKTPANEREALSGPDREIWIESMLKEYGGQVDKGACQIVLTPPNEKINIIDLVWIFKWKIKDGTLIAKSRLCVRGFQQIYGVDYFDTYSPVLNATVFRLILALATYFDCDISHLDTEQAFIQSPMKEKLYTRQPRYFEHKLHPKALLIWLKSIYGAHQAQRNWYQTISSWIVSPTVGFKESTLSRALFYHVRESTGEWMLCGLFVDDKIITGTNKLGLAAFKANFLKNFTGTVKDSLDIMLGYEVTRSRHLGTLHIKQSKVILRGIEKYENYLNIHPVNSVPIPMDPNLDKNEMFYEKDPNPDPKLLDEYRSLIGILLYLSICTRPDIANAVRCLGTYVTSCTKLHFDAAIGVLAYLRDSIDLGITYYRKDKQPSLPGLNLESQNQICCYVDSSYASNLANRRSTTGFAFYTAGGVICHAAKLHTILTTSSHDAEFIAMGSSARESFWLVHLLRQIFGKDTPERKSLRIDSILTICDNEATVKSVKSDHFTSKSKHLQIREASLKELYAEGVINPVHVKREHMIADLLTKNYDEPSKNNLLPYLVKPPPEGNDLK
jgi:hypothetical protein